MPFRNVEKKDPEREEDMNTLRLLRQQIFLRDQMLQLGMISPEEWDATGEQVIDAVRSMEVKYGIEQADKGKQ